MKGRVWILFTHRVWLAWSWHQAQAAWPTRQLSLPSEPGTLLHCLPTWDGTPLAPPIETSTLKTRERQVITLNKHWQKQPLDWRLGHAHLKLTSAFFLIKHPVDFKSHLYFYYLCKTEKLPSHFQHMLCSWPYLASMLLATSSFIPKMKFTSWRANLTTIPQLEPERLCSAPGSALPSHQLCAHWTLFLGSLLLTISFWNKHTKPLLLWKKKHLQQAKARKSNKMWLFSLGCRVTTI